MPSWTTFRNGLQTGRVICSADIDMHHPIFRRNQRICATSLAGEEALCNVSSLLLLPAGDQVAGLRTPLKGFYVELAQRLHCSGDIHKIGIGPTAR